MTLRERVKEMERLEAGFRRALRDNNPVMAELWLADINRFHDETMADFQRERARLLRQYRWLLRAVTVAAAANIALYAWRPSVVGLVLGLVLGLVGLTAGRFRAELLRRQ